MPASSQFMLAIGTSWLVAITGPAFAFGDDKPRADEFNAMAQDSIVPSEAKLELLWSEGEFTEGPVAAGDGAILFSDIGDRILRLDPKTKAVTEFRAPSGKSNGLEFNAKGELVACEGAGAGGNRRISITDTSGKVRTLADRYRGKRFNSPNDLAIAASGDVNYPPPRSVGHDPRYLDFEGVFLANQTPPPRGAPRDVEKPNGIIVTPDGKTVYVSDNNSRADGNHQLVSFMV